VKKKALTTEDKEAGGEDQEAGGGKAAAPAKKKGGKGKFGGKGKVEGAQGADDGALDAPAVVQQPVLGVGGKTLSEELKTWSGKTPKTMLQVRRMIGLRV